jgi:beta-mannosidase
VSSPSNGLQSEEDGFIAQNPSDPNYGDIHYYNYIQDLWSMDTFQRTRFASEFGFQSIPSSDTLSKATNNLADLDFDTEFINHRQHHPNGFNYITNQVELHLNLRNSTEPGFFEELTYFSQVINEITSVI